LGCAVHGVKLRILSNTKSQGQSPFKTITILQLEAIADFKARELRAGQDVRLQADGQSIQPLPPLVARITVVPDKDDAAKKETKTIQTAGHPYVKPMKDIHREFYDKCLTLMLREKSML
jgi:hypothetical protein